MTEKKELRKRDIYMISILLVIFAILFFMFQYVWFAGDATYAYVYYGLGEPIVSVDFANDEVVRNFDQILDDDIEINYPIIETDENSGYTVITLLGDYKIDGVRQEVVIEVDFVQDRLRVFDEKSPLNVCSKQGWSTSVPLICLPNKVRVEFDSKTSEVDFVQ